MALESNHDLPADILEKLQNLELELEEGDITLKGFEKKKANLLASVSPLPSSPQQDEAALLAELGPEPSAADVTDFLDFLPSPTHSPVRNEGAALMEEHHKQQQQQQQQQPYQQQPQPQYLQQQQQSYQNYSQQPQQQQQQYQQYQYQQTYQNDVYHQGSPQLRQSVPGQYRPYPQMAVGGGGGNSGRPINNNPIYYNNNPNNPTGSPIPNNRPYMMGRPQQRPPPGSNPYNGYVAGNNGYAPYRPSGAPQYNPSRPSVQPQPQSQQQAQQQHMYNSPRPISTSPRPVYRPNPNNPAMYNYRPTGAGYTNQRPPPPQANDPYYNSVNRSLSTSAGMNTMAKQRQGYTDRQQHSMSMYSTGSESEWNQ